MSIHPDLVDHMADVILDSSTLLMAGISDTVATGFREDARAAARRIITDLDIPAHDERVRREYAKALASRIRSLHLDHAPATPDPESVAAANSLNRGRQEARQFLAAFVERGGTL